MTPPARNLAAHLPSIPSNIAPGAAFLRLYTDDNRVIAEHPTPAQEDLDQMGQDDRDVAFGWLRENPSGVIFVYLYDGDTGACQDVAILAASDVRAYDKGTTPESETKPPRGGSRRALA